jgi:hypothetical protein
MSRLVMLIFMYFLTVVQGVERDAAERDAVKVETDVKTVVVISNRESPVCDQ